MLCLFYDRAFFSLLSKNRLKPMPSSFLYFFACYFFDCFCKELLHKENNPVCVMYKQFE